MIPRHAYVTLEDPDTRALALADPRRFLQRFDQGAVLDEVQRAPDALALQTHAVTGAGVRGEAPCPLPHWGRVGVGAASCVLHRAPIPAFPQRGKEPIVAAPCGACFS